MVFAEKTSVKCCLLNSPVAGHSQYFGASVPMASSKRGPSSMLELRIQGIPETVTEHVEPQDGDQDGKPGKEGG